MRYDNDRVRFGPAGACDEYNSKYNSMKYIPEHLTDLGLNALEYQCGRGVNINEETAEEIREKTEAVGISVSVHAPYFISLSGIDEEKRLNSLKYIAQAASAVRLLGGRRIIIHAGSASKIDRASAVALACDTLKKGYDMLDETGFSDIIMCPETLGKLNQLGTVSEICELCRVDERMLPCIDFGHINSMTNGSLKTEADYEKIFETIRNMLGGEREKQLHIHFSKIEYTEKGGEKRHLTFEDTVFGPDFEPLANVIVKRGVTPVIICESSGTQGKDANAMMKIWEKASANP